MVSGFCKTTALALAAGGICSASSAQILYSNCNLSTGPTSLNGTAAGAGLVWSEVARDAADPTNANTVAGFGGTGALRLADDFVVPAGGAVITAVRIYAYTNGVLSPAISAGTLQILDGSPAGAPNVLFGDQTTNRVLAGSNIMTNVIRVFNTVTPPACGGVPTAPATGRRLQQVDLAIVPPLVLGAGTYWVDYNFTGVSFAPPSTIASAIGRQCNPANANGLQFNAGWVPLNDTGQGCVLTPSQQDMYFEVIGSLGATTGACCVTSGASNCIITTSSGCTTVGGTYQGDNSTCAAANCPPLPTGACCFFSGSCQIISQASCVSQGGTYSGNNVTCQAAACPSLGWQESGDAGNTPGTAQVPTGSGNLAAIRGTLTANDVDMFKIKICNESAFGATTVGGATFDTQLFLFNLSGTGVAGNDDTATPQAALSSTFVTANGDYLLAISGYDNDPIGAATLQEIWLDTPFNTERAPDGPAAAEALSSWSGTGGSGGYTIALTGTCYPGGSCYANCDGSTGSPLLTANDFQCFANAYAANASYANCDGSTGTPALTANDFQCFANAYAAGCS